MAASGYSPLVASPSTMGLPPSAVPRLKIPRVEAPDKSAVRFGGVATAPVPTTVSSEPAGSAAPGAAKDVVQFTSKVFYATEDEGQAVVDIMRIGHAGNACSVKYVTEDATAVTGVKYHKVSGVLTFEAGELLKQIVVPVVQDDFFDVTVEFKIKLLEPVNCKLVNTTGREMTFVESCVFICDDDIFPSNRFREEVAEALTTDSDEPLAKVSIPMLMDYMKFTMLRVPSIWWKTICTLLLDQLHNFYHLMMIYVQVYLVDTVLDPNGKGDGWLIVPGSKGLTCVVVALLYVFPRLVLLLVDYLKRSVFDMAKPIRCHLQVNVFRKYLNYTEDSKNKMQVQDLVAAMDADIPMIVEDGYMFVFKFSRSLGKIVIVAVFILKEDARCLVPFFIYPVAMYLFIKWRQEKFVELETACIQAAAASTGILVNAAEGFALIRDYGQRTLICEKYSDKLEKSTVAHNDLVAYTFWNDQMLPWLTFVIIGLFIAFGSELVLTGAFTIGEFLAMLSVFQDLGGRFEDMYGMLQSGVQAGSPLVDLTLAMNFKVDVKDRMEQSCARREYMRSCLKELEDCMGKKMLGATSQAVTAAWAKGLDGVGQLATVTRLNELPGAGIAGEATQAVGSLAAKTTSAVTTVATTTTGAVVDVTKGAGAVVGADGLTSMAPAVNLASFLNLDPTMSPFDKMPFAVKGLSVGYVKCLKNIDMEIPPSTLTYITGTHSSGKNTFVKVLTDVLLAGKITGTASKGTVLYSSHLRILHVDDEPAIVPYLSLFENLTFGVTNPNAERVKKLFSTLCTDRLGEDNWLKTELEMSSPRGQGSRLAGEGTPLMESKEPGQGVMESARTSAADSEEAGEIEGGATPWHLKMAQSERKMVHLCRAFMFNPEILVLNKPLDDGDMEEAIKLLEILREFVDNRGVEMPPSLLSHRRPRTAFFSGGVDSSADEAKGISDIQIIMEDEPPSFNVRNGGKGKFPQFPAFNETEVADQRLERQAVTQANRKNRGDDTRNEAPAKKRNENVSIWSHIGSLTGRRSQDPGSEDGRRCCY